jgi:hypothetical protein
VFSGFALLETRKYIALINSQNGNQVVDKIFLLELYCNFDDFFLYFIQFKSEKILRSMNIYIEFNYILVSKQKKHKKHLNNGNFSSFLN